MAVFGPVTVTWVAARPSTVTADGVSDRASNGAENVTASWAGDALTCVPSTGVTDATVSGGGAVDAPATDST